MMRSLLRRLGATLSEAGQKVGERMRQIDTDELKRDAGRFTERVAVEIRDVLDNLSEQSKSAKTANMESEIASVLRDLKGCTVTSPIYDNQGEVIIMQGTPSMKPPCAAPSKATKSPSSIASPCRSHREKTMSKLFRLNEAAEGEIYEIVSVDDTRISDEVAPTKA